MHKDCEIMMMEQRSDEWFKAHRGVPSASNFHKIVTSQCKKSSQWNSYLCECVDKMLHGYPTDEYRNEWMEHGIIMEPFAREQYQKEFNVDINQVGFVKRNGCGCSPDGIVDNRFGIEIKCPSPKVHIDYIRADKVPTQYYCQIQSSMWITGLKAWDFYSYSATDEMKFFCKMLTSDKEYHAALNKYIPQFLDEMHDLYEKVKA